MKNILKVFTLAALIASQGITANHAYAQANLQLVQEPLFLINRIKPNFIIGMDDSGSMDFEVSIQGNDGSIWWNSNTRRFFGLNQTDVAVNGVEVPNFNNTGSSGTVWKKYSYLFPMGTGTDGRILQDATNDHFAVPPVAPYAFARSPDYNGAYFNPLVSYDPWLNFDGTSFPQINPTNAPADPRRGTRRLNLTQNFSFTGAQSEFIFHRGMIIPQGTVYRVGTCSDGGTNPTNTTQDPLAAGALGTAGFRVANVDRTLAGTGNSSRCSIGISYFPATFYIQDINGEANAVAAAIGYNTTQINRVARSPGDASGNNTTVLARFEIRPGNFTSTAAYTAAINNYANWFSYYRKRQHAVRAGVSQAFNGFDFIRVGYFTINNRVNVTMRDMALADDRLAFYNQVLNLTPNGGTPNRDAVNHMGLQFRRNGTGAPITLECQRNFGMLFTDGFSDPTTSAAYGNVDGNQGAPFADAATNTLADIAMRHYLQNIRPDLPAGRVPVSSQCNGSNPDPRLDCRRDPHMNFYGVTLGARGIIYDPDATPAQDAFTLNPNWPTNFPARHPSAIDDIWHATVNTRGRFLNARTPRDVASAVRSVLVSVQDASVPAGRDATSGARVTADSFFVIPSFSTANNGTDWTGSLVAYQLRSNGAFGDLLWATEQNPSGDAANTLPDYSARNLFVVTSPGNRTTRVAQNFTPASLGTTETARFTRLGVTSAQLATYPGLTSTQAVNYLRGDDSLEIQTDTSGSQTGGILRARSSRLGDIVNSIPVIFTGSENFGYATLPGSAGTSYLTYLNSRQSLPPIIYVGANDGYLRAFDGRDGSELYGVIPNASLDRMGRLLNPQYQHTPYVDGVIAVSDAQIGGNWGTALVSGMGAGSRSIFAMDVTNPLSVTANNVLWELNGNSIPEIGHIFGRPLILPVRGATGPRWVAIVGNGYNSTYGKPALLVIDLNTGAIIANLKPTTSDLNTNGLGNLVAIADGDGYVSRVYGGDMAGNVWRFNLAGSNPSSWGVGLGGQPLFRALDENNNPQPITGGFDVARGPNNSVFVYFGTGRYIAEGDNQVTSSTQLQTVYAVLDRETSVSAGRAALAQRQITAQEVNGARVRVIPSGTVNFSTQQGWYLDLKVQGGPNRGEMFIGYPRVEGGQVYFSTFEPVGDACTPGGVNWLYGLDALTGSAGLSNLRIPGLDIDGDGVEDRICQNGCGAVETGGGAPVPETVVLVPPPVCIPGSEGCDIPVSCSTNPDDPTCVPDDELPTQEELYDGCVKIISVGGRQVIQPRPCGRQSWRQVR